MTKASIITPTADRGYFLNALYSLLKNQTYPNWEWLIYDTSLHPHTFSDSRVIYQHDDAIISIGEKRNRLIERASGDIVIHCDDDDYYAPTYLAHIVDRLQRTDFFTAHSWFSYDLKSHQTYYWATNEVTSTQFFIHALTGVGVREIDFGSNSEERKEMLNQKGSMGYGFSYAYVKEVALKCHFKDCDFKEDKYFHKDVLEAGFSINMEADQQGRAIHIIHETNTSGEYPQYRIPNFLVKNYFPDFFNHLAAINEN